MKCVEWDYDEYGFSICPDCLESMIWGDRYEERNHSPDCEIIKENNKGLKED